MRHRELVDRLARSRIYSPLLIGQAPVCVVVAVLADDHEV
jgi:hypothetical protein